MIIPATKPPSNRSSPSSLARATSANTRTTASLTPSWLDASKVRSMSAQPRHAERTARMPVATASATKNTRISASCSGVARREHQRHEQDGPEFRRGPGREEVRAEACAELAGVPKDRDQGPDGGRGYRRSRVEAGNHYAGGGEHAGHGVRQHQRDQPARARELERLALDPLEVDLIAGEEEEHPEAEVAEELGRGIEPGDSGHLWADEDAEHQLDHDHRDHQAGSDDRHEQSGERRDRDDHEERRRVDADHRVPSVLAMEGNLSGAPGAPGPIHSRSRGLTNATNRALSASRALHVPPNSRIASAPVGYLRASFARSAPPLARSRARRSIAGLCPMSMVEGTASGIR